jgi:hypothetical protein
MISVKSFLSLLQAFNQDCVVNPFVANEGQATAVGRKGEVVNVIAAQTRDQSGFGIVKGLFPEGTSERQGEPLDVVSIDLSEVEFQLSC